MFRPVIAILLLSAMQGFTQAAPIPGAVHDFDFLFGSWKLLIVGSFTLARFGWRSCCFFFARRD